MNCFLFLDTCFLGVGRRFFTTGLLILGRIVVLIVSSIMSFEQPELSSQLVSSNSSLEHEEDSISV